MLYINIEELSQELVLFHIDLIQEFPNYFFYDSKRIFNCILKNEPSYLSKSLSYFLRNLTNNNELESNNFIKSNLFWKIIENLEKFTLHSKANLLLTLGNIIKNASNTLISILINYQNNEFNVLYPLYLLIEIGEDNCYEVALLGF